jgi:radical SAM protein with 4Fe4S-binding SPASM domain
MSSKFCILPFIHLDVQPDGNVFACCHSNDPEVVGNLHEKPLAEIWESKVLNTFQEHFLSDGKLPPHCNDCLFYESVGAPSWREVENKNWQHIERDQLKSDRFKSPRSIGIRFSNLCNFACRTCKPAASTSFIKDAKFLYPKGRFEKLNSAPSHNPLKTQIEPFLKDLQHVGFAGGEPLLEKEHYEILDLLIETNPDVELSYDTNLSVLGLGKFNAIEQWRKLKNVNLSGSADGFGSKGEFIRNGLNWNKFVENWNLVKKELPHVRMKMNFTLSVYNMFHVLEFVEEVQRLGLFDDNDPNDLTISLVEEPRFLSLQSLPKGIKETVQDRYQAFINECTFGKVARDLQAAIKFMNGQDTSSLFPSFLAYNKKLDFLRSETFDKLFVEEGQLFDQFKKIG